ncbi:hypothetical protein N7495_004449 [Penicillium taxi]|uniref:uncharacterized protein n=1 Tax=Penicillium taxi TaxID=168475 RepID=UPI002545680F|nr:uncharacterized protein N7495_004449 [Penicillium taxi]KAJ5899705.1 hypothetical protein N7495_004449 [Penicillium taxi]
MSSNPKDVLNTINLVTQCLCIPIVTFFIGIRFYVRIRFKQIIGLDDYTCTAAWLLFMGYCGISIVIGDYGGGYNITDVSDQDQIEFKKFCYIATILYCPMALFSKIALLSMLARIFAPYRHKVLFIHIFLGCLCIYYVIALVIKIRMCSPVPMYWRDPIPSGSCLDQTAALIADSVISVVSDVIILLLPLPLTWSLQMPKSRKLRVMALLGAGGLATGFSLFRLVLVCYKGHSANQTIFFIQIILSGNAEGGMGLICACLPLLNVLISYARRNYSSQKYYHEATNVPLDGQKSVRNSKNPDMSANFGDQSHLISFVGVPGASDEVDLTSPDDGIVKTVAVSQTIETHADGIMRANSSSTITGSFASR